MAGIMVRKTTGVFTAFFLATSSAVAPHDLLLSSEFRRVANDRGQTTEVNGSEVASFDPPPNDDLKQCLSSEGFQGSIFDLGSGSYNDLASKNFKSNAVQVGIQRPKYFVVVADKGDVARVVRCGKKTGLKVCARCGGGSFTGASIGCSTKPSMIIDLHKLKGLTYNMDASTVTFEPGLTLGELLYQVKQQSHDAATVVTGSCIGVGAGGYLLGGGMGSFDSIAGLLCDRLESLEMVTADGQFVSETRSNSTGGLFWSACGGGGQALGLLVSATVRTLPTNDVGHGVCVRVQWAMSEAFQVFKAWSVYSQNKAHLRLEIGSGTIYTYGCFFGVDAASFDFGAVTGIAGGDAQRTLFGYSSATDVVKFMGPRGNWGRDNILNISDEVAFGNTQWLHAGEQNDRTEKTMLLGKIDSDFTGVEAALNECGAPPRDWGICTFIPVGNAVRTLSASDTAFPWRQAFLSLEVTGSGGELDARARWVNSVSDKWATHKVGTYVNYPDLSLEHHHAEYWGPNTARLQKLKQTYDPDTLFDAPQGIQPKTFDGAFILV